MIYYSFTILFLCTLLVIARFCYVCHVLLRVLIYFAMFSCALPAPTTGLGTFNKALSEANQIGSTMKT